MVLNNLGMKIRFDVTFIFFSLFHWLSRLVFHQEIWFLVSNTPSSS